MLTKGKSNFFKPRLAIILVAGGVASLALVQIDQAQKPFKLVQALSRPTNLSSGSSNARAFDGDPGGETAERIIAEEEIQELVTVGSWSVAGPKVDARIASNYYGSRVAFWKGQWLTRLNQKPAALDWYMHVVRDDYHDGGNRDLSQLGVILDLAVQLNDAPKQDEIATHVLNVGRGEFYDYPTLGLVRSGSTANERLAYAYLWLGFFASTNNEIANYLTWAEKALVIAPTNRRVRVQVCSALHDRGQLGDQAQIVSLMKQAWQQETPNSDERDELQDLGHLWNTGDLSLP